MTKIPQAIKAAAILYDGKIYTGWRHDAIFKQLIKLFGDKITGKFTKSKSVTTSGFITNNGSFVDRQEAFQIAKDSGQLIKEFCDGQDTLTSEMLWDEDGDPIRDIQHYQKIQDMFYG